MRGLRTLLEDAGGSLDDVVRIHTYVLDLGQWPTIQAVWAEYWGDQWPASTAVQVEALSEAQQVIEMDAIAVVAHNQEDQ